jgi:hypothetical protein
LDFHGSIQHSGATVQYFILNSNTFDLVLLYQRVFNTLPQQLHDLLSYVRVPEIILIRYYVDRQIHIYLIVFQTNATHVNIKRRILAFNRGFGVNRVWTRSKTNIYRV